MRRPGLDSERFIAALLERAEIEIEGALLTLCDHGLTRPQIAALAPVLYSVTLERNMYPDRELPHDVIECIRANQVRIITSPQWRAHGPPAPSWDEVVGILSEPRVADALVTISAYYWMSSPKVLEYCSV